MQGGRQTQTDENKQFHPMVQEAGGETRKAWMGILEKCQAKHTSMEARRGCQGALMRHA